MEPLHMRVVYEEVPVDRGRADFIIDLEWENRSRRFVAEYQNLSTPRKVESAIAQARSYVQAAPGLLPMIIVPYLSPGTIDRLLEERISGLDLSGNSVIIVPGEWLVLRTGAPNKYPTNLPIKGLYEGTSSLVGRVLLSRPEFDLVKDVQEEILNRGGEISLGTVSKILKGLEENLVVQRRPRVKLLNPERLLDELAKHYKRPQPKRRLSGKVDLDGPFFEELLQRAEELGARVAGRSETLYAIAPRSDDTVTIYATELRGLVEGLGFQETSRFANVEILQIDDPTAYFDAREVNGFLWCSPLQIYLELASAGKREQETARQLRDDLLNFSYA